MSIGLILDDYQMIHADSKHFADVLLGATELHAEQDLLQSWLSEHGDWEMTHDPQYLCIRIHARLLMPEEGAYGVIRLPDRKEESI